jgi:hypothetical protein
MHIANFSDDGTMALCINYEIYEYIPLNELALSVYTDSNRKGF